MSKEKDDKKKEERGERGSYDEKLQVKGSFLDIMKAAVKDADNKSAEKKEDKDAE